MKTHKLERVAFCPDCDTEILLEPDAEEGQTLTCPECWAYLKILSLDPPELIWYTEEEDEEERDFE